jgi:threonine dehydratase
MDSVSIMITLDDIVKARARIARFVHRTPTVPSHTLSKRLGTHVHLKLELFQRTGSFKPRAAFSRMLNLTPEERSRGVVAFSGGNFAQGVAYAAGVLGIRATICMPETTPRNYLDATRGYGAEVELLATIQAASDRYDALAGEGMIPLHPFDDPDIMAGSGSIGLELLEDIPQLTDVVVSVGGGGLMTGVTIAVQSLKPDVRVWSVETENANSLAAALAAGHVVRVTPTSLARTLGAPYAAQDALTVAQTRVSAHTLVSDAQAFDSQRFLMERTKIFPELSAACTLSAADKLKDRFSPDGHVALILCGGNVSVEDVVGYWRMFAGRS